MGSLRSLAALRAACIQIFMRYALLVFIFLMRFAHYTRSTHIKFRAAYGGFTGLRPVYIQLRYAPMLASLADITAM